MSYYSRRIRTPGASRKRKERESFYSSESPSSPVTAVRSLSRTTSFEGEEPPSNRLLAGYMAHEFLTKGTIFGQKFDPARAEAVPVGSGSTAAEWRRNSKNKKAPSATAALKLEAEPSSLKVKPNDQSYAEVASLLKSDGAHIQGVVNPTQLARWIQM